MKVHQQNGGVCGGGGTADSRNAVEVIPGTDTPD